MIFELPTPPETNATGECAREVASVAAASQARRSGEFAKAALLAGCVLQVHPDEADAWFELGAAKYALGEKEEAQKAWMRTLDLAPANDDARLALARLTWADGDKAAARRWLASVSPVRRQGAEALELQAQLDSADQTPPVWRIDASVAQSSLTKGLPDWSEARVSAYRRHGSTGLGLAIEHARRFDREDTYFEAVATYAAGSVVWSLALGGTPEADFRPEQSVRLGGDHYGAEWDMGAAFSHAEYVAGQVDKVDVRLARELGPLRLQATGVAVHDETGRNRYGYGVGAVWKATSALAFDAGWSNAPESSDGLTVNVRSAVLGATINLSEGLRLRAGLAHEMRDAYDRTEISAGLARTF